MKEIVELTEQLKKIAKDYGQGGSKTETLPPKAELAALVIAAKDVALVVHSKEIEEIARNST